MWSLGKLNFATIYLILLVFYEQKKEALERFWERLLNILASFLALTIFIGYSKYES